MKLISEQSRHTDRKILKPQVEKRRRERMNRSLDNLKTLLMLQEQSQRRVEKAEILEQTVAFLHNHHKRSFHDGFSSCLQMATRFLGPDRKDVGLGAALDASLAARLAQPDSADLQRGRDAASSSALPHTKTILQLLKSRCNSGVSNSSAGSPAPPQRHQLQTSPQSKQSPSQSHTLWRPWP
ncbi:transcription factor HES-7.1-A-like [Synchiropus splendidus]|uniref:transcription factor HES-7.1-A-like n=1 Tax=Synchiropus splendidus TaxID=270530 RepID=UPI00237ECEBB|nr:transcription factor HES-7.1-A-like [Synchiropus splendidus]